MSNHVTEWLNAYYDGELRGNQLQRVEAHLAECQVCQAELESLQGLSGLLHEMPMPEFTPVDRFAAQVSLRLPHEQMPASTKKITEIGWWMIPVGLLGAWVFVATSTLLSEALSVLGNFGLLSGMSSWLASGPSNNIYLSTTIGQMGLLNSNSLSWAESIETLTRMSWLQITLHVSIALLYLGWLAIWWARHTPQENGQLLEG